MANISVAPANLKEDVGKLAVGAGTALAGKIAGRAMHVVTQVVLARLLGPPLYGLYTLGWTLLRLAGIVAPLGFDRGVIRYGTISGAWRRDEGSLGNVLFQSLSSALLSGLAIAVALYLATPWIAEDFLGKPELVPILNLFVLALPFLAGLRVAAAATRISQSTRFSVYAEELAQPAANLILVLVFFLLGWQLLGAVAASVASFVFAFLLALRFLKQLFSQHLTFRLGSVLLFRKLTIFSLPASMAGVFTVAFLLVDRLMVGYFRPARELGIYQAASQSAIAFTIVLAAFNAIFIPMIVDLYQKKELTRLQELFRISTKWSFYLCLPVFLTICFAPQLLVTVVFGQQYEESWLPLVILSLGQMVSVGTGPVGSILMMTGHQTRWFWISGILMLTNIGLNFLFIPVWGIVGAAIATALSTTGLFLLTLWQVRVTVGLWPYDSRYRKGVIAGLATVVALYSHPWITLVPVLELIVTALVAAAIFTSALLLLGLDPEDRLFLRMTGARVGQEGRIRRLFLGE